MSIGHPCLCSALRDPLSRRDHAKPCTNKGGLCSHRSTNKEIEYVNILQQKFGKNVVGMVKDKPWKVVLKKL